MNEVSIHINYNTCYMYLYKITYSLVVLTPELSHHIPLSRSPTTTTSFSISSRVAILTFKLLPAITPPISSFSW
ncbi:hypothetical protein ACOSQ4_016999 [Xanthoceras sorbifolium]